MIKDYLEFRKRILDEFAQALEKVKNMWAVRSDYDMGFRDGIKFAQCMANGNTFFPEVIRERQEDHSVYDA